MKNIFREMHCQDNLKPETPTKNKGGGVFNCSIIKNKVQNIDYHKTQTCQLTKKPALF